MATACVFALAGEAAAQQPVGNSVVGPPSLGDFSIAPRPRPQPQIPAPTLAPTPAPQPTNNQTAPASQTPPQAQPQPSQPRPAPNSPTPRPAPAPVRGAPPAIRGAVPQPAPSSTPQPGAPEIAAPPVQAQDAIPAPATDAVPTLPAAPPAQAQPAPIVPSSQSTSPARPTGGPPWLLILGAALIALLGLGLLWRRRAKRRTLALPASELPVSVMPEPQPMAPRAPRPDPVPRPWIELDLVAERATADAAESIVEFELTIRNSGGSDARNIRLQAKLICGTMQQDQEIADFHRKKPGEHRTINIPDLPAGQELRIRGQVDVKREDIKALQVEQRLLFIPLVAVNAFYDWSSNRSGQTSRSFLVGREPTDPKDRMAPFRLDLGPRVYRTVGQRPYKIERRV